MEQVVKRAVVSKQRKVVGERRVPEITLGDALRKGLSSLPGAAKPLPNLTGQQGRLTGHGAYAVNCALLGGCWACKLARASTSFRRLSTIGVSHAPFLLRD